ncbi:GNAT family N-acetyltransferase [Yoonia sp. 208BN28-4]|uniref:GNAT family N-acetyltransferase n=1 Tax=Yoonia sp. 208BN28-4 TaxID=3126505 RepID=UPI0030AD6872
MTLTARKTIAADAPALADLFNHTVRTGGTTAHEEEWDVATFQAYYMDDPTLVHTALNGDTPVGFQAVSDKGDGVLSIGSFTDQRNPVRGAGSVMFAATRAAAKEAGFKVIDAKIRADNVPGLAYYSKMGFEDFKVDKGVPLADGTPMDRITKRLIL